MPVTPKRKVTPEMERYIVTSTAGIIAEAIEPTNPASMYDDPAHNLGNLGSFIGNVMLAGALHPPVYALGSAIRFVCGWLYALDVDNLMATITDARLKAHAKHGDNSIEAKRADEHLFWQSCLGEEFGEVCSTYTYDKPSDDLIPELIDLLTVLVAWAARSAVVE